MVVPGVWGASRDQNYETDSGAVSDPSLAEPKLLDVG